MMELKKLRDGLSVLADKIPDYSAAIRNAGFTCCHNRDDWIAENCSEENIIFHRRYTVEFARECIMTNSPSEILYGDDLNCHSAWLNELKAERLKRYGPVDVFTKSSKTRHLLHLSPCLRELSRITESPNPIDQEHAAGLVSAFTERWSHELMEHHEAIERCASSITGEIDEASLQKFYAETLAALFRSSGAQVVSAVMAHGRSYVVAFQCGIDTEFVICPLVTCSKSGNSAMPSGKVGMGFRLYDSNALRAGRYVDDGDVVLHLNVLLPKEFIDYGRFKTPEEFSLNILARSATCSVLVPDVLTRVRCSR
ncbi:MAG TPA: hypothetical protein VIU93_03980 [Gallionellaceae bacterium]